MLHTNKNYFFMPSGQKLLCFAKQPKLYNWNFKSDNFYSLFFKANVLSSKKPRNLQIKRFAQGFVNTCEKKIKQNDRKNLRLKAETLSGEIFKESFIDILHTNFEQVAFSAPLGGYFFGEKPLELTKTTERKANVDFSTEKIWRVESKITREHRNRRLSKTRCPSLRAVPQRGKEGERGAQIAFSQGPNTFGEGVSFFVPEAFCKKDTPSPKVLGLLRVTFSTKKQKETPSPKVLGHLISPASPSPLKGGRARHVIFPLVSLRLPCPEWEKRGTTPKLCFLEKRRKSVAFAMAPKKQSFGASFPEGDRREIFWPNTFGKGVTFCKKVSDSFCYGPLRGKKIKSFAFSTRSFFSKKSYPKLFYKKLRPLGGNFFYEKAKLEASFLQKAKKLRKPTGHKFVNEKYVNRISFAKQILLKKEEAEQKLFKYFVRKPIFKHKHNFGFTFNNNLTLKYQSQSKRTPIILNKKIGDYLSSGDKIGSFLLNKDFTSFPFSISENSGSFRSFLLFLRKSYVPFSGGESRRKQKPQHVHIVDVQRCRGRFFTKSLGYKKSNPYTEGVPPFGCASRTRNSKISKGFLLRPEKPYKKTFRAFATLANPQITFRGSFFPKSFGKKKHKLKASLFQSYQAFDKFNFLRITKSYKNKKMGDKAFYSPHIFSRSCSPLSCCTAGLVELRSTKKHRFYQSKTRYGTAKFFVEKIKEFPQAFSTKNFAVHKRGKGGIEKAKERAHPIILNCSGRILTISKTQLVLQKTQPVLFYNSANLHVKKGEWVKEGSPILTLTHQTLITGDIVQGIPRIEQLFEAFTSPPSAFKDRERSVTKFQNVHDTLHSRVRDIFRKHWFKSILPIAVRKSLEEIQYILVESIQKVYLSQGVLIADKHIEIIIRQIASKGQILDSGTTGLFLEEILPIRQIENANLVTPGKKCLYVPAVVGLTAAALSSDSFISAASFQETTRVLSRDAFVGKSDFLRGLKEKVVIGDLISAGTGLDIYFIYTTMMAR